MRTALARTALLAALLPAAATTAHAQLRMNFVGLHSAFSTGGATGVERWDTLPMGSANVYLSTTATPTQSSDFLNPNATLDYALTTAGTYTFHLRTIRAFNSPHYGVSVFFNTDPFPGISAVTPFNCVGCSGSVSGPTGPFDPPLNPERVLDGYRITFRSFTFGLAPDDRVGTYSAAPDGNLDYAGVLQFDVAPVAAPVVTPEPASVGLLGLGLAGVGAVVRRRRALA